LSTSLTPAGARRVYRILLYLHHDRGETDPTERAALEAFRQQHGLSDEEASQLEAEHGDTARLVLPGEADRPALIEAMIQLVAADGCLEHDEQVRLQRVANVLGLPKQELADKLLERLMGG
jgi:uncharacterized tellurite resistance protein B-like protein